MVYFHILLSDKAKDRVFRKMCAFTYERRQKDGGYCQVEIGKEVRQKFYVPFTGKRGYTSGLHGHRENDQDPNDIENDIHDAFGSHVRSRGC
jgi:hypothetical protein